jgi:hypothetical protein
MGWTLASSAEEELRQMGLPEKEQNNHATQPCFLKRAAGQCSG